MSLLSQRENGRFAAFTSASIVREDARPNWRKCLVLLQFLRSTLPRRLGGDRPNEHEVMKLATVTLPFRGS